MRRRRKQAGLSLVELAISATLSTVVLVGANKMLVAGTGVAQSTNDAGVAARRVELSLHAAADALRRGSVATALRLDGTAFIDTSTDAGFKICPVIGYHGAPETGALVEFRWDSAASQFLRVDGPIETVLADGVTHFAVTRSGTGFDLTMTARSGPQDDRERQHIGTLRVAARNP